MKLFPLILLCLGVAFVLDGLAWHKTEYWEAVVSGDGDNVKGTIKLYTPDGWRPWGICEAPDGMDGKGHPVHMVRIEFVR